MITLLGSFGPRAHHMTCCFLLPGELSPTSGPEGHLILTVKWPTK